VQRCKDRKTVVFLPLIKTIREFNQILESRGFWVVEVNDDSNERAEIIKDFDEGEYDIHCNSMLLTEGWDCQSVDCSIVLSPTKVRSVYSQIVDSGTRLYPGKKYLLLLDLLWHTEHHELCHPVHLRATSYGVARKMTENIEEAGCPVDIEVAEAKVAQDVVADREESLAKLLQKIKHSKKKLVDPLQF
jgi:superfamily II DNA or RNA helicase